jgi:hypothetical protein
MHLHLQEKDTLYKDGEFVDAEAEQQKQLAAFLKKLSIQFCILMKTKA